MDLRHRVGAANLRLSALVAEVGESRPGEPDAMLGYLAILGATLSGLAGLPPWTIAAATIALTSLSYAEHHRLYERGQELGLSALLDSVLLRSMFNGLIASGVAYGGGWVIRVL